MLSIVDYRKILITLAIAGISASSLAQHREIKKDSSVKTILFVCEHGAGRSTIAATYFNKIAEKRKLKYHAIFRGVEPQKALGVSTKNGLIKDGIDVTNLIPARVTKKDVNNAYKVVTLDVALPDTLNKEDLKWSGIQWAGNYAISKGQITSKVDSLITMLTTKKGKRH